MKFTWKYSVVGWALCIFKSHLPLPHSLDVAFTDSSIIDFIFIPFAYVHKQIQKQHD